ncbi:hypothetical protein ACEWY4_004982 [Coilia grayii]|uniref:Uncharacterized protein n=1 Tax=Coilia grayii TaxID=363190 RepID=A0ABD1KHA9_9TELE
MFGLVVLLLALPFTSGAGNMEELANLPADHPPSDALVKGDPESEQDIEFFRTLNSILHAKDVPIYAQREIMGYYHRKSLAHVLRGVPQEEKHNHVVRYYTKGAHLVGLQSRQLLKFIPSVGHEDSNSPYCRQPCLKLNYRPHNRAPSSPKIKHTKSSKSRKTVEIEHHIRQLSVEREGVETLEMVTPVRIKVPLKVKNRGNLTYDDINQIRRKAEEGLNLYLHTLMKCKRWDALHSWSFLQKLHPNLGGCVKFPETFSTYSWSWSGGRNIVEIRDLVNDEGTAVPPPSPSISPSTLPKST